MRSRVVSENVKRQTSEHRFLAADISNGLEVSYSRAFVGAAAIDRCDVGIRTTNARIAPAEIGLANALSRSGDDKKKFIRSLLEGRTTPLRS